jgi:hypothetical protein
VCNVILALGHVNRSQVIARMGALKKQTNNQLTAASRTRVLPAVLTKLWVYAPWRIPEKSTSGLENPPQKLKRNTSHTNNSKQDKPTDHDVEYSERRNVQHTPARLHGVRNSRTVGVRSQVTGKSVMVMDCSLCRGEECV